MAKVRRNILLGEVSGRIGDDLVLKRARSGTTILCRKPTFSEHRVFSKAQREHHQRFREAAAYAKQAAKREPIYAEVAKKTRQPAYNVALADFMHPPEIMALDLSGYTGKAGEVIRVQARDNVKVKQVSILIKDADGQIMEQGLASEDAASVWWTYRTTVDCPTASATVVARAQDLPGHWGEREGKADLA